MDSKRFVTQLLRKADIRINGSRSWDIQVHDERLYSRIISGGTLALGESYMDRWWDVKQLDVFFDKVLAADLEQYIKTSTLGLWFRATFLNFASWNAKKVADTHYNLGNDLYTNMLGKWMQYSCGYWNKMMMSTIALESAGFFCFFCYPSIKWVEHETHDKTHYYCYHEWFYNYIR